MRLNDAAVDMFNKMVGSLFAKGRRGAERKYQASSREVAQLMRVFSGAIEAVDQARAEGGEAIDRIDAQVGWAKLLDAKPKVDALAALAAEDPLVSAADRYATLRRFAPTFLEHVRFKAGTASNQATSGSKARGVTDGSATTCCPRTKSPPKPETCR
jgi:hypothetical protein